MAHVLVVDDREGPRIEVVKALQAQLADLPDGHAWRLSEAETPEDALDIIRAGVQDPSCCVDIVLADRKFPGSDDAGIQLIEDAIRADKNIICILYSSQSGLTEDVRTRALERGAFDVVKKESGPPRQLILKFQSALRRRALEQQVEFLRRYFDPRVFDQILQAPELLKPQQRLVTIGFWDIRKFSPLCQCLVKSPDSIAGFLSDYGDCAARVIFDNNGILDKFIGDGVMALFGVLQQKEDDGESDALDAVRSAVALRDAFEQLVAKWMPTWKRDTIEQIPTEFGLGCGLHTATALVGNVGTRFRDQFTALGRDVNSANRVEMRSKAAQILISQPTKERVDAHVITTACGELEGKPGEASMVVYLVEGFRH